MLLIDKVVSLVAPHLCVVCGGEGSVLCDACLVVAGEPPTPRCVGCKALSDGYKTCKSCRSWMDVYAVYVATEYGGVYESLLHAYKFGLKRQAAEPMAAIMGQLNVDIIATKLMVVAIPTAPARVRERGFDHGRLLARQYYYRLRRQLGDKVSYEAVLGRRTNKRQLGSSRAQRISQVDGEFFVKDARRVAGCTILLTDDVTTTGASLAAAARALKRAGAERVYAVIYAQKV